MKPHSQFKYKPHSFHYCYCNDFATLIYFAPFQLLVCGKYFGGKKKKKKNPKPQRLPILDRNSPGMPGMCKTTKEPFLFILLLMKSPFKEDSALEASATRESPFRIAFRFEMRLISQSPGGFGYLTILSFALNSRTVMRTAAKPVKPFSSLLLSPGSG